MQELEILMRNVLSNTFIMYFRTHSYHWNVEGPNFMEYHGFFNTLYDELFDAVDPIAEEIRALDLYAPISLADLYKTKTVQEDSVKPDTKTMFTNLIADNEAVLSTLNAAFKVATAMDKQGLINFLASRIDVHNKHGWMLRSYTKAM